MDYLPTSDLPLFFNVVSECSLSRMHVFNECVVFKKPSVVFHFRHPVFSFPNCHEFAIWVRDLARCPLGWTKDLLRNGRRNQNWQSHKVWIFLEVISDQRFNKFILNPKTCGGGGFAIWVLDLARCPLGWTKEFYRNGRNIKINIVFEGSTFKTPHIFKY